MKGCLNLNDKDPENRRINFQKVGENNIAGLCSSSGKRYILFSNISITTVCVLLTAPLCSRHHTTTGLSPIFIKYFPPLPASPLIGVAIPPQLI